MIEADGVWRTGNKSANENREGRRGMKEVLEEEEEEKKEKKRFEMKSNKRAE